MELKEVFWGLGYHGAVTGDCEVQRWFGVLRGWEGLMVG